MLSSVQISNSYMYGSFGSFNVSRGVSSGRRYSSTGNSNGSSKKKLNYNPREISLALMQAKRSQSAKQITITAKVKLANLLKCQGTGMYDENQLRAAIAHARRMVDCAKMKAAHLADEENDEHAQDKMKKNPVVRKKYDALIRHLEEELRTKKKKNRSKEYKEINDANIEYLKQEIKNLKEEAARAESSSYSSSSSAGYAEEGFDYSVTDASGSAEAVAEVPAVVDVLV